MAKLSQIDKAIALLEGELDVLVMAIAKLKQQQKAATPKKPKAAKVPE